MDIFRDPMWQFLGAIFGFVAILVSIFLYQKQRQRKELAYEIISKTPLLGAKEEIRGGLQVMFHGKPVQNPHLIVVRIINSGNLPITSTDYERPISLGFGEEAQILTAETIRTNPSNLRASVKAEGKKVVIAPILLNQGDSITLKILIAEFTGQVVVDCRITGVKRIMKFVERKSTPTLVAGLLLMMGSSFIMMLQPWLDPLGTTWQYRPFIYVAEFSGIALLTLGTWSRKKKI